MGDTTAHALDRVLIVQADLLRISAIAIVNAANTELWLGGGVAGAIASAGGPAIETEAMAQGPIPVGAAVLTRSGQLANRGILYVIHAATMEPGQPSSPAAVASATRSALALAASRQFPSIAFPALGTGVGGVSLPDCALAMLTALCEELQQHNYPRTVHLACFDSAALQAFRAIAASLRQEEAAA